MFSQFDNEEVEAYFNRLNAPLKKMPDEDRAEIHQELRQHLDALAAAHEELGATPQQAIEAALRQFGDPAQIGRRLRREWEIRTMKDAKTSWPAVLGVAVLETAAVYWYFWNNPTTDLNAWQYGMFLLAPPVLAGGLAGWVSPRSSWRDLAIASLPAAILLLVAATRDFLLFHRAFLPPPGLLSLQHEAMTFALVWGTWLPIGWACAAMTRRFRRPIDKRHAARS